MESDGGLAVVMKFLETVGKGDFEGATALLDPDIVVREPPALPFGGDHHGVDGFRKLTAQLVEMAPSSEGFECFDAGETVVVRMAGRYNSRTSGESVVTDILEVYEVRGGRVAEVDVYLKDPSSVAALSSGGGAGRQARERTAPTLEIDFRESWFIHDPFPAYERIREAGRVVWNPALQAWMVTSFADCSEILRDRGGRFAEMTADAAFWFDAPNMLSVDGAEHSRLRDCLKDVFSKSAIMARRERVVEVVDELLAPLVAGADRLDLTEFTTVPTVLIADMLGVPQERHEDLRRWSHTIATGLAYTHESPETIEAMKLVAGEVGEYLTEEIERHRNGDFDDVLSHLLTVSDMTDAEVRSTALVLLLAGYDTTAKLLATSLVTLERHPRQRAALAADPSLMPGAVEEILRYAGVSHIDPRVVVEDTEIAGTPLAKGETVYAILGAANRDPQRWPDPHTFAVDRKASPHIAFGFGPHLCLGLWLARVEAATALNRLLEIAPEYRLHDVTYSPAFVVRGPDKGYLTIR